MAATNARAKDKLDTVLTDLLCVDGLIKAHRLIRSEHDAFARPTSDPDVRAALDGIADAIYIVNGKAIDVCDAAG